MRQCRLNLVRRLHPLTAPFRATTIPPACRGSQPSIAFALRRLIRACPASPLIMNASKPPNRCEATARLPQARLIPNHKREDWSAWHSRQVPAREWERFADRASGCTHRIRGTLSGAGSRGHLEPARPRQKHAQRGEILRPIPERGGHHG